FEDCYCGIGERHTVLAAALHSPCRHGPHPGLEVYLIPPCTDYLPGPGRCQYREFERPSRDTRPFSKIGDEHCHLGVGQRRVMLNSTDFWNVGQEMLEVATKSGRILTVAITACLCPIQNGLDPTPNPSRGFGLSRPQRLQDFRHQRCI